LTFFVPQGGATQVETKSVLLVGSPALPLKGFDTALLVLAAVNRVVPLIVTWSVHWGHLMKKSRTF
jgi:hypothetical protein